MAFGDQNTASLAIAAIGLSTDKADTLWAQINRRHDDVVEQDQKQVIGDFDDYSMRTVCGRTNNLMNLLSFTTTATANFLDILKHNENSLINMLARPDFPIGVWYDKTETCFGVLHALSEMQLQTLFADYFQLANVAEDDRQYNTAQKLLQRTLIYADIETIEKSVPIIINAIKDQRVDQSFLELFEVLHQTYLDVVIGIPDDPSCDPRQSLVPLFSKFNALKDSCVEANVILEKLEILKKDIYPKTLEQFLNFYELTGLFEEKMSLASTLISVDAIGSSRNIAECGDDTFFTIFSKIIEQCCSKEQKFRLLMDSLGNPTDTKINKTVFGKLSIKINELDSSFESTFKRKWIGQYIPNTYQTDISLFSCLVVISNLLHHYKDDLSDTVIDRFIKVIGIYDDDLNSSLFGVVSQLSNDMNLDEFALILGANNYNDHSCFHFVSLLKSLFIPTSVLPYFTQPQNLHNNTIRSLFNKSERDQEELRKIYTDSIVNDCIAWLHLSILPQLSDLRTILVNENTELVVCIGNNKSTNLDSYDILSRTCRVIENLKISTQNIDFASLYSSIIKNINLLQSKIYETHAKIIHDASNELSSIIGNVISDDESLFGLINTSLRLVETNQFLWAFSQDRSDSIISNIKSLPESGITSQILDQILSIIGKDYEPCQAYANTLVNVIGYFYEVFNSMSSLFSYENIKHYAYLVIGPNGLLEKSIAMRQCTEKTQLTDITGYQLDNNDETMWSICNTIYDAIFQQLRSILLPSNMFTFIERIEEYASNDCFFTFLKGYKAQIYALEQFMNVAVSSHFKFNVVTFLKQIFSNDYTNDMQDITYSQDLREHNTSTNIAYFLMQSISPSSSQSTISRLSDVITQSIHTLIVSSYLDILINDTAPSYVSVFGKLNKIRNDLTNHTSFNAEIKLIGESTDSIHKNSIECIGVFSVFNEIIRILSSPSFFVNSILSFDSDKQNVQQHWLFNVVKLFGNCYDNNSSIDERNFFTILDRLIELINSDEVMMNIELITSTLGTQYSNLDCSSYRSLFSVLNAVLRDIVPDYSVFVLTHSPTQRLDNVCTHLCQIYELLQTISYEQSPHFTALKKIGNPEIPSGFFLRLNDCISAFHTADYLEPQPMTSFLLYSKTLYDLIKEFTLHQMSSPQLSAEDVDVFVNNADVLIYKLLSFEQCNGCERIAQFLRNIDDTFNSIIQSLSKLTNDDLVRLYTSVSFTTIKDAVCNLSKSVNSLLNNCSKNKRNEQKCIVLSCDDTLSDIENKLEAIRLVICDILCCSAEVRPPQVQHSMCQFLPKLVQKFGSSACNLANSLKTPIVPYFPYNEENVQNFEYIVDMISSIFNDVKSVIELQNCGGCKNQDFSFNTFFSQLKCIIDRVIEIKTFIKNSYLNQLVYQCDQIAKILQKTSAYTVDYDLITLINQQGAIAVLENLADNLSITSLGVNKIQKELAGNNEFQRVISYIDELSSSLSLNFKYVKTLAVLTGEHIDQSTILDDTVTIIYDNTLMPYIFDKVVDYVHRIAQHIVTLSGISVPAKSLTNRVINIFKSISASYSSICDSMFVDIPHWIEYYNISEQIIALRLILSQKICPSIDIIIQKLKEFCIHDFTVQLSNISSQITLFSSNVVQIQPTDVFLCEDKMKNFLSRLAQNTEAVAKLFEQYDASTTQQCTHLAIQNCLDLVLNPLIDNNAALQQLVSFVDIEMSSVKPQSLSIVLENIHAGLSTFNNWVKTIASTNTRLDTCNYSLFAVFTSLQSSSQSIYKNAYSLLQQPICIYFTPSFSLELIVNNFDNLVQIIRNVVNVMNSDLSCCDLVVQKLNFLEQIMKEICVNFDKTLDFTIFNSGDGTQFLQKIKTNLLDINTTISCLNLFLAQSFPGTCINGFTVFLDRFSTSLLNIATAMYCEVRQDTRSQSKGMFEQVQSIENYVLRISQSVLEKCLTFTPTNEYTVHISLLDDIHQSLAESVRLLHELSQSFALFATNFLYCFPQLNLFVDTINNLSDYILRIAYGVHNILDKMCEQKLQATFLTHNDEMMAMFSKLGVSNAELVLDIEQQLDLTVQELNKIRKTFGYMPYKPTTCHCPVTFAYEKS